MFSRFYYTFQLYLSIYLSLSLWLILILILRSLRSLYAFPRSTETCLKMLGGCIILVVNHESVFYVDETGKSERFAKEKKSCKALVI